MNEKTPVECKLGEKIIHNTENQENGLEKNESRSADLKLTEKTEQLALSRANTNIKLNADWLDNRNKIEEDLSDGETSSDFGTLPSLDYNVSNEIVNLGSPTDNSDLNVCIQIENERGRRTCFWKDKSTSPARYSSRTQVSNDYNRRHNSSKISREEKYWQSKNQDKYKYDRREKRLSERKDFTRKLGSRNNDSNRSNAHSVRHIRKKRSEWTYRSRTSRSPERSIRVISPGCKGRKVETRHSGNSEKSTTKPNVKSSPLRKRKSSSVWKRLDDRKSSDRVNNEKMSLRKSSRKKERTPFLVELERKLKEANRVKNLQNEAANESLGKEDVFVNMNKTQVVPEQPTGMNQNTTPSYMPSFIPAPVASTSNVAGVGFPLQYTPLPTLSLDNLPLVPGSSGLPVHITERGEEIPHDLDGRPIPVGPYGHYLPLDPTGRLFPHIVSPGNQAVPIHMTEDGVLRLPNSDPVPYGPSHQLPVNIDGRIIFIGPDSKPLYPCLNLPRQPPLHILNMMNSLGIENLGLQKVIQMGIPQVGSKESEQGGHNNEDSFAQTKANPTVEVGIQNCPQNVHVTDSLIKHRKKGRERRNNVLKSIEIGENGANLSKEGIKGSTPVKFSEKETFKGGSCCSDTDMILGSDDCDSSSVLIPSLKPNKGSIEEIILSSDDERETLQKICDKGSSTTPKINKETKGLIIKKVKHAIKSLCEKNYRPPVFGRFIVSNLDDPVAIKSPNESPLLRNRLMLPFLVPNAESPPGKEISKKTAVTFTFLPQKISGKGEKDSSVERGTIQNENLIAEKIPVFTFDFAVQCDFTSLTIKKLATKVAELEMEVVRLRNINANLLDGYKNVQAMNKKKSDELRKTLREIRQRNNEIQLLKRSG